MPLVVVTRTVIHWRWRIRFMWGSLRAALQARNSSGYLGGSLRIAGGPVFWTLTLWQDGAAMNAFRESAAHGALMPKMARWAGQASTTAWKVDAVPSWDEALVRMSANAHTIELDRPDEWHLAQRLPTPSRWAITAPVPPRTTSSKVLAP